MCTRLATLPDAFVQDPPYPVNMYKAGITARRLRPRPPVSCERVQGWQHRQAPLSKTPVSCDHVQGWQHCQAPSSKNPVSCERLQGWKHRRTPSSKNPSSYERVQGGQHRLRSVFKDLSSLVNPLPFGLVWALPGSSRRFRDCPGASELVRHLQPRRRPDQHTIATSPTGALPSILVY